MVTKGPRRVTGVRVQRVLDPSGIILPLGGGTGTITIIIIGMFVRGAQVNVHDLEVTSCDPSLREGNDVTGSVFVSGHYVSWGGGGGGD